MDATHDGLLSELSRIKNAGARAKFLDSHAELIHRETVLRLGELVREQAAVDRRPVIHLAESAVAVARRLHDQSAVAHSLRTKANALYLCGHNRPAVEYHRRASKIFTDLGDTTELARTLSASIQPLILLGQYDRASLAVQEARRIFETEGNEWRLARVDLNAGNILHRQDRFAEALTHYRRACGFFASHPEKDSEARAVALHNLAMCLVGLNDFPQALAGHEEARRFASEHGMHILVRQADYNIASLHYFRGEHNRAIELLRATLETCVQSNDDYHVALCNLDLSDIYLELNQGREAERMAQVAGELFQRMEMGYEAGKALSNVALATWQQGHRKIALRFFAKARKNFVREKNRVWPSRINLYRATILVDEGQYPSALRLCRKALKVLQTSKVPHSLVATRILIAQIYLLMGKAALALRQAKSALQILESIQLPALRCQTQLLIGRIREAMGQQAQAYECYDDARKTLEVLRTGLRREELRTSFMRNRLEVYERLVELCIAWSPNPRLEEAFEHVEQSKSRSLRDLMQQSGSEFDLTSNLDVGLSRKVKDLRAEIHWYSHKYEAEQGKAKDSPERLVEIQSEIRKREDELLRIVREMPFPIAESAGLVPPKAATVDEVRSLLSPDATLLEYFQIRDQFAALVLRHNSLQIVPLAPVSQVNDSVMHLHFQLSKFRLGPQYVNEFIKPLTETTLHYLKRLYDMLVGPVQHLVKGNRLFIVPHSLLHSVPFQALFDGERYLIDSFCMSYAPSATILRLCNTRTSNSNLTSLVLGISDAAAPLVLDEVRAVAATIEGSRLFVGEAASAGVLRTVGEHSRLIHIATHGYFRQDNPMFSGIRLGDGVLSVYDLYQMKLPAELITLSGCATGVNLVTDGDELLGLVRGLIYAGARSAMLTLWDVHDRSTSEFMTCFYGSLSGSHEASAALRQAAISTREMHPHPYYWAPFVLVGG